MITVKEYLTLSGDSEELNEAIRKRSRASIRNTFNVTLQKLQRTDDIATLIRLNSELLQLIIELQLKGK